jgi:hypothetical protein
LSGAVNNDVPAALCGAAVLWACMRLVRDGPSVRDDVVLGLLLGLALLTKFNLLALLGLIELAYVLAAWPERDWRAFLRGTLVVLGSAALVSGWWFWRNEVLYGEPTGFQRVTELWGARTPAEARSILRLELPMAWSTLWGRFGYGQVPMPAPVYRVLGWLSMAGGAGLVLMAVRRVREPAARPAHVVLLLASVLLAAAVLFAYILVSPAGAMGRFFFPGLPAFALLLFLGLSQWLALPLQRNPITAKGSAAAPTTVKVSTAAPMDRQRPAGKREAKRLCLLQREAQRLHRWIRGASVVVGVGMAALAVYALVGVLAPAFARPRPLAESEVEAIPNPTDVEFALPSTERGSAAAPPPEKGSAAALPGSRPPSQPLPGPGGGL